MPIKRRTFPQAVATPSVGKRIKLRNFTSEPRVRDYADSIEEYIFSVPKKPMKYTDLVVQWIVPYQESHFKLFGMNLKLTPMYQHCPDNLVKVTGILVEIKSLSPTRMQRITGPVGLWHGRIKFFAKANMKV